MENISNRHESDLGGKFSPFGSAEPVELTIRIAPILASFPAVQHTAWMLLNLLCRLEGVVGKIGVECPAGVPVAGRIVPFSSDTDFLGALLEGAAEIGIVPVHPGVCFARTISVGAFTGDGADLYVYGEGWWGGIATEPLGGNAETSTLPFGPYLAACIAAGEVFKAARMDPAVYSLPSAAFYSAWHHRATDDVAIPWLADGPATLDGVCLDIGLAGVGAVGCAWVHALWACEGLTGSAMLADNDTKGVESTNLNRYALFGRSSLGKPKATEAMRIAQSGNVTWIPFDHGFEQLERLPNRVISAVDKNWARQAIQQRYPARILSGSTLDLRAEILRCGPPGIGACLRCFNPPERITPDEEIRAHVDALSEEELTGLASKVGISAADGKAWAQKGTCGTAGERLLPYLRQNQEEPIRFAVGFVSVMAGTLLAAETIKDVLGIGEPLSDERQRAAFQFWEPASSVNSARPYLRDSACPMCNDAVPAKSIWKRRFEALPPVRSGD